MLKVGPSGGRERERVNISPSVPALGYLEDFLNDAVEQGDLDGGTLHISRHDETLFEGSFGVYPQDHSQPICNDCIFSLQSASAFATTLLCLRFLQEARLSLDDPIALYLPEFASMSVRIGNRLRKAKRPILIKDLLLHTSGLNLGQCSPEGRMQHIEAKLAFGMEEMVTVDIPERIRRLSQIPLAFEPGSDWAYSPGPSLLGEIFVRITGKRLDRIFQESLFDPMGLEDSGFYIPPEKSHRLVLPRQNQVHFYLKKWPNPFVLPPVLSAGKGLYSSRSDWRALTALAGNRGIHRGTQFIRSDLIDLLENETAHQAHNSRYFNLGKDYEIRLGGYSRYGLNYKDRKSLEIGWWGLWGTSHWYDREAGLVCIWMSAQEDEKRYFIDTIRSILHEALTDS